MQKPCKFASSSLDYDDIDAAIKNLPEALHLLHKSKRKLGKKNLRKTFQLIPIGTVQCRVIEFLQ